MIDVALSPLDQLERTRAVDLRGEPAGADLLHEGLADHFLEREHGGQDRPWLLQYEAHRVGIDQNDLLHGADKILARARLAIHRAVLGQAIEGELDVLASHLRPVVEQHVLADLELVGGGVDLLPGLGEFRHHLHLRVARQHAVVEVAQDRLGLANPVVRRVEIDRVEREAHREILRVRHCGKRECGEQQRSPEP